jgi:hypothetical protein
MLVYHLVADGATMVFDCVTWVIVSGGIVTTLAVTSARKVELDLSGQVAVLGKVESTLEVMVM